MIETARKMHRWIVDRSTPRPIVFHHAPKCGGTSVGRALRRIYLLSQATVYPEETYRAAELLYPNEDHESLLVRTDALRQEMFHYLLLRDVRCISAHVRFSPLAYERFSGRYVFATLLREPTARFMSNYFYSFGRRAHGGIFEPIETFLATPAAVRFGSTYSAYYSGLPPGSNFTTAEAVERAKANLVKFAALGFTEAMPAFARQVSASIGRKVSVGHANRAEDPQSHTALPDSILSSIRQLCAPDIAIYTHALALGASAAAA